MEEIEDDPSSEMLAIELYSPAVYAARTFDLLYVPLRMYVVPWYRRYSAVSYRSPPHTVSNPSTPSAAASITGRLLYALGWMNFSLSSSDSSPRHVYLPEAISGDHP